MQSNQYYDNANSRDPSPVPPVSKRRHLRFPFEQPVEIGGIRNADVKGNFFYAFIGVAEQPFRGVDPEMN